MAPQLSAPQAARPAPRRRAVSPAIWAVALALLRRRRAASVGLAIFAGLAAAAPMAVWAAGRHTGSTVERSLEQAGAADVMLTVCPPGFDPAAGDPVSCLEYNPEQEVETVRSLPGVTEAVRATFTFLRVGPSPDHSTWRPRAVIGLSDRSRFPTVIGEPQVVSGRLASEDAPDELMVNEVTARAMDLEPGDPLWVQGRPPDEDPGREPLPVQATVAGVVRTVADLLPLEADSLGVPPIHARAGWSRAHAHELPPEATQIFVSLDDGDLEAFQAGLQARLGHQALSVAPAIDEGERSNLEQATTFESRAALAVASVAGLAVVLFLSQAVSRQGRAESSDVPILLGLGMTRRQLLAAGVARWLPIAVGGAAVAIAATLGASILGPVGLARRAPWEPGVRADALVLVVGAALTAALILLSGAITLYRTRHGGTTKARPVRPPGGFGPPSVRAGVAMARRSLVRGGALPVVSALVGTALAVTAVITASGGAASLRRVADSPERFGAPWDALVSGDPAPERQAETLARLAALPGLAAAAAIPGSTVTIDDRELWIQAMVPIEGIEPVRPVITAGREPTGESEIALGAITMRQFGLDVGGEVSLRSQFLGADPRRYRVVGVTMVSDGYEPNVGKGGLVTREGLERVAPESAGETNVDIVVRVVDGPGRAAALAALQQAVPYAQIPFPLPSSIGNAERIAGLPLLLAIVAAALAAVTLTHALVVTVRRNRRELAVFRVLGFTRGQVYGAVAAQATVIAFAAASAGVFLGVIGARWGWQALATSLGVASGPIVPVVATLVSVVAVLLVANVAAAASGRGAARLGTADVLRAE